MLDIIYLLTDKNNNKSELVRDKLNKNFDFNLEIIDITDKKISSHIKVIPDLFFVDYIPDKHLHVHYHEVFNFSDIFLIPSIFIADEKDASEIPSYFSKESNDIIIFPFSDVELKKRIEVALTKNSYIKKNIEIDRLTGLPNIRSLYSRLNDESARSLRYNRTFVLALIDIRNFKDINSFYGKYSGDSVLKTFAELLIEQFRKTDYIARFYFDKFAVIMPETDTEKADITLRRIIDLLSVQKIELKDYDKEISLSLNAGISEFPKTTCSTVELIQFVKTALQNSKDIGENICSTTTVQAEKKKRILVIDDEEDILYIFKELLEGTDKYEVKLIRSAEKLFMDIKSFKPDLIITDLMMPFKDGYRVCEEIKSNITTQNIPILISTGKGNLMIALESGADDYIIKPVEPDALVKKIDTLLTEKEETSSKLSELTKLQSIPSLEKYQFNELLSDHLTKLPTIPLIMNNVYKMVRHHISFGLIYISVIKIRKFEKIYGEKIFDDILTNTANTLKKMQGQIFRTNDLITISRAWDNDFIIFLSPPRKKKEIEFDDIESLKKRIEYELNKNKNENLNKELIYQFDYYLESFIIENDPHIKFDRLIYSVVKEAMAKLFRKKMESFSTLQILLKKTIKKGKVDIVFQPIINTNTGEIFSFEALSRGPKGTPLEKPKIMFNTATEMNMVWQLERICHKNAVKQFSKCKNTDKYLFLNIEPPSVYDPGLRKKIEKKDFSIPLNRIVFEITERTNIKNMSEFKKQLEIFRNAGCKLAIDDAGTGYSSLLSITDLDPDIIKINMILTHNIHKETVRRDIVQALVEYAHKHKIKVVAEGIEILEEFKTVKQLGIDFVQGFYFEKPSENIVVKKYDVKI